MGVKHVLYNRFIDKKMFGVQELLISSNLTVSLHAAWAGLDNTMLLSMDILILITNAGGVNDTTTDYSGEDHMETKCAASVV